MSDHASLSELHRLGRDVRANRAAVRAVSGFDIVTPAGVRRRIAALDAAWQGLNKSTVSTSSPAAQLVKAELAGWMAFRTDVLNDWLSTWFASGTLNELDGWQRRYEAAYQAAGAPVSAPKPSVTAPPPPVDESTSAIASTAKVISYAVIAIGGLIALGAAAYLLPGLKSQARST